MRQIKEETGEHAFESGLHGSHGDLLMGRDAGHNGVAESVDLPESLIYICMIGGSGYRQIFEVCLDG